MFVNNKGQTVSQKEVETLFMYEDFLKETKLKGITGKIALKHLRENTYKKYMLYQRLIRTTYKVFR